MNFDMSVNDNFASFVNKSTGVSVFVDSFDNKEFEVRIGTITNSESVGKITAFTDEELNKKLAELYEIHREGK